MTILIYWVRKEQTRGIYQFQYHGRARTHTLIRLSSHFVLRHFQVFR